MANQGKRMVQEDELKYLQTLKKEHEDPTAPWGGGGGSDYTAGEGITIEDETISVNYGTGLTVDDETLVIDTSTVALKTDIITSYNDLTDKPTIPVMDNKTIVLDTTTNKYKTAIGGYKETTADYLDDVTLSYSNSSYNIIDSTIANNIYNALEVGVEYPVTITLTDSTATKTITSAYIKASTKTATKFGGASTLYTIDSSSVSHTYEFYADISTNKVNIWFNDGFAYNGTLKIEFLPYEIWNTINANAIPDITSKINTGLGLQLTQTTTGDPIIRTNIIPSSPLGQGSSGATGLTINLNYDTANLPVINNKLTTAPGISGKYNDILIATKDVDYTYANNYFTFSNNDIMTAVANVLLNESNHRYNFRVKYNTAQTQIQPGNPTISDNTYTYTGNFAFTFTDNQNGTITINSPMTIYRTSSADTITLYDLPYTNGSIQSQIDAKFIPVDGSTITVDSNGKLVASGGGSSYTFTNGLTDNNGTVSFDYNKMFSTVDNDNTTKIGADNYGLYIGKGNDTKVGVVECWPYNSSDAAGFKGTSLVLGGGSHSSTYSGIRLLNPAYGNTYYGTYSGFIIPVSNNDATTIALGHPERLFKILYAESISDGTNTISVSDLAALITYAKAQGWIS